MRVGDDAAGRSQASKHSKTKTNAAANTPRTPAPPVARFSGFPCPTFVTTAQSGLGKIKSGAMQGKAVPEASAATLSWTRCSKAPAHGLPHRPLPA